MFQDTIDQLVVLAVFLPVLAGQSGNTGCQALAVVLRGITLGELERAPEARAVVKEACLGFLQRQRWSGSPRALACGSTRARAGRPRPCDARAGRAAGDDGQLHHQRHVGRAWCRSMLRRLGADPATASSIFLTTATDVASMGMFLGLAKWLVL